MFHALAALAVTRSLVCHVLARIWVTKARTPHAEETEEGATVASAAHVEAVLLLTVLSTTHVLARVEVTAPATCQVDALLFVTSAVTFHVLAFD